jgi:HTH-type transcriptional regulator/antitoxin HipB
MEQIVRTAKQVGATMRRHRRALGITQKDLAAKTHLRQATISALEAGESGMQLRTLFHVMAALSLEAVIRPRTKATEDIEDLV